MCGIEIALSADGDAVGEHVGTALGSLGLATMYYVGITDSGHCWHVLSLQDLATYR